MEDRYLVLALLEGLVENVPDELIPDVEDLGDIGLFELQVIKGADLGALGHNLTRADGYDRCIDRYLVGLGVLGLGHFRSPGLRELNCSLMFITIEHVIICCN